MGVTLAESGPLDVIGAPQAFVFLMQPSNIFSHFSIHSCIHASSHLVVFLVSYHIGKKFYATNIIYYCLQSASQLIYQAFGIDQFLSFLYLIKFLLHFYYLPHLSLYWNSFFHCAFFIFFLYKGFFSINQICMTLGFKAGFACIIHWAVLCTFFAHLVVRGMRFTVRIDWTKGGVMHCCCKGSQPTSTLFFYLFFCS